MPAPAARPFRHPAAHTLLIAVTLTLGACSAGDTGTSAGSVQPPTSTPSGSAQAPTPPATPAAASASAAPGAASAVTIADFAFTPARVTVGIDTTVTWTNTDSAPHTVTADDGSFDSKALATGATFSQTFTKEGPYAYHCSIHTSMKAMVTVLY